MTNLSSLSGDTIVAIATAPGRGGIGVVRLSGPRAIRIGQQLCGGGLPARQAIFSAFTPPGESQAIDSGLALAFPGPASFTGEDVVELQGHGSPVALELLVQACCDLGARLARAGEFSERAFLNDKLDLAQAEAIADLINATTASAARGALRSLRGEFSRQINRLIADLVELRVYVEAAIDFPEEEIDFLTEGNVSCKLEKIYRELQQLTGLAHQGSVLRDGMKLVIAGKPNAGKSSLLNALSGQDTAIVTPIEGTTRDVLREHIQIDGMPLHIVDTAGLRSSADLIEQEGIRRAWQEMESADRILLVADSTDPEQRELDADHLWPELHRRLPDSIPVTLIHNKADLSGLHTGARETEQATIVTLSAKTGDGVDALRQHLKQSMGFESDIEHPFLARRRHLQALQRAQTILEAALLQLRQLSAGELLAEDLRRCHKELGEITGAMSSDELLGEIFSSFCIGK